MEHAPHRFARDFRHPAPGVYFEELAPRKAAPFLTGTPAFLGIAQPATRIAGSEIRSFHPYRLTAWEQFHDLFDEVPGACLGEAVRGFFANGGRRCLVIAFPMERNARRDAGEVAWSGPISKCLEALERVDDVDLLCAPDLPVAHEPRINLQRTLLEHCRTMGDRFAILDPIPQATVEHVVRQWHELVSTDGALYFPWLRAPSPGAGFRRVPPCGHLAGVFARTDSRLGTHKPPANEPLEGIVDVDVLVTDDDQRLLSHVGVNSIRAFPGRGIRVWGGRTLSGRPEWRHVNVRRLFLALKRWIDSWARELAFEPNDPTLWNYVRDRLATYGQDLFRSGALKGVTLDDAFFVKCDAETNTPATRDRGEVVAEVGLAPARPAEFIVVRITQTATGTSMVPVSHIAEGS